MAIPSYNGWPVNTGGYIPSGSHFGTARSFISGGGGTNINIRVNNYGNNGYVNPFMTGYYDGGSYHSHCHSDGISTKDILTLGAVGLGVGIGVKYGGTILKGIGQAATWTWNSVLKPTGNFLWNSVLKPVGKGIGQFFTRCWNACTGKGWTVDPKAKDADKAKEVKTTPAADSADKAKKAQESATEET